MYKTWGDLAESLRMVSYSALILNIRGAPEASQIDVVVIPGQSNTNFWQIAVLYQYWYWHWHWYCYWGVVSNRDEKNRQPVSGYWLSGQQVIAPGNTALHCTALHCTALH